MLKTSYVLLMAALAVSAVLPVSSHAQTNNSAAGGVFVMTNAADKNEIIAYKRGSDGSLQAGRKFSTGGRGSGGTIDPLASQGALTLSRDRSLLLAVTLAVVISPCFESRGRICC